MIGRRVVLLGKHLDAFLLQGKSLAISRRVVLLGKHLD